MSPDGSTSIRPITGRRSLAPPSSARRPIGLPRSTLSLAGERRVYHVSRLQQSGLGRASRPGVRHLRQRNAEPLRLTPYLVGPGLTASFGLLNITVVPALHLSWPYRSLLVPDRREAGSRGEGSRRCRHPKRNEGSLSRRLRTSPLPATHAAVGDEWQNIRLQQSSKKEKV
jgi:hypothetical protein